MTDESIANRLNRFSERLASQGSILYGGDYNPEQWPRETWKRDMELLRGAGINEVTLNVFSWALLQPDDDTYDFSMLDDIVQTVSDAGMAIMMATSTGSLPAWMVRKHPDVARVEFDGTKRRHGYRHNHCATSPTYRRLSAALAGKLAQRYGALDNLVAWHVNNEYNGFCWCERCGETFRQWLRERYGSIEAVNEAWNTNFWGHTYHSFDDIFPPNQLGDAIGATKSVLPAFSLDYRRWYGGEVLASFNEEKRAIREFDPVNPVTTNFIGHLRDYDYLGFTLDPDTDGGVDVSSWDAYPSNDPAQCADVCMRHDLYRTVSGGRPFILMEQTPSRQNWAGYCPPKRPGQMRLHTWQAIAHGADAVQFFQLKQSRSGCEKFHGAVLAVDGTDDNRTYLECAELGRELARVTPGILGSRVEHGRVAFVYDYPSHWGIDLSAGPSKQIDYIKETLRWYEALHQLNIPVDFVPAAGPFDGYDAVVAPLLYMVDERATASLRSYVQSGGRLLTGAMSLMVDEHDSLFQSEAPAPIRDLAGVRVEETDALAPGRTMTLNLSDALGEGQGGGTVLCDVLRADEGTQVLATYGEEFYAGRPAITFRPSTGRGGVFYCGVFPDDETLARVTGLVTEGIAPAADVCADDGMEVTRRIGDDGTVHLFVINPTTGPLKARALADATELISGREMHAGEGFELEPFGVAVLRLAAAEEK